MTQTTKSTEAYQHRIVVNKPVNKNTGLNILEVNNMAR